MARLTRSVSFVFALTLVIILAAPVYGVLDPSLDRAEESGALFKEFTYAAVDGENALDIGPSSRAITNALMHGGAVDPVFDGRGLSMFHVIWMQFLDHMTVLTDGAPGNIDIPIPLGDPVFDQQSTGTETMALGATKKGPGRLRHKHGAPRPH